MHAEAEGRLIECVRDVLKTVRVTNNAFPVWPDLAEVLSLDEILPARSAEAEALLGYIGEEPVSDFVIGRISDLLTSREYQGNAPPLPLAEIPEFSDLDSVSERLVEELKSLPWRYRVYTPLPAELGQVFRLGFESNEFILSESLRIVAMDAGVEPELSRQIEPRWGLDTEPEGVYDGATYLSGTLEGYIGRFGASSPLKRFEEDVRAFFGLALALGLARPRVYTFFGPSKRHILIFHDTEEGVVHEHAHELQPDVADTIRGIGINKVFKEIPEEAKPAILKGELKYFLSAFQEPHNEKILRAAQWLFDSYATRNGTLSFVQATVAIEILFGDKRVSDLVGLGELLGNRLAFLIGTSREQREEVLRDFRRIYDTRSRIVHQGHHRLTVQQQRDLTTLRWMVMRAVRRELDLDMKDAGQ